MILPTLRASIGRRDALQLVDLIGRGDEELRAAARRRLEEDGVDALLDDPRTLNALLTEDAVKVTPDLVFYVVIRQGLLEAGVEDRGVADYVASVVVAFGRGTRAYRVSDGEDAEYRYLVDLVERLSRSGPREGFLLRTHIGNYALWISGLFPDWLEGRARRRGAPPLEYYERLGAGGFREASGSREARSLGLQETLEGVSRHFTGARQALNTVADRHFWPRAGDPVGRLLRSLLPPTAPEG